MVKFGERVDRRTLTITERVLLHIYEKSTAKGVVEAPFPLTQQGIAHALRMRVNHVSRAVKALEAQRCVAESTARVRGEVRKRKVYLISHEGHVTAQALMNELGRRSVHVRDEAGVTREMTMAEARKLSGGPYPFTDLLSALDATGVADVSKLTPGRAVAAMSRYEEGRPRGEPFFGRSRELGAIREWASSPVPALVVQGPRGIGKSATASKALDEVGSDRHTFWHTVREGDDLGAIARAVGTFLASTGRGDLAARLMDRTPRLDEVESALERDWPASNAVLVLDDADLAPPDVVRALVDVMRRRGGKVILTADRPLPEQARLRASGALQVLPLGALEKQECHRLAAKGMPSEEFEKAYRLSGGNPLSMKLLSADALEGLETTFTAEERALLRVLKLRQESE